MRIRYCHSMLRRVVDAAAVPLQDMLETRKQNGTSARVEKRATLG